jgi:hypothetical protein
MLATSAVNFVLSHTWETGLSENYRIEVVVVVLPLLYC